MDGQAEKKKRAAFLSATDWERVDSNLERLPYLAWQLEEHTPKLREPSRPDEVLFTFAQDPQWKEKLPQASRKLVEEMILEYQRCLGRIRVSMAPVREQPHRAGDTEQMAEMLESYENKTAQESYREAAARGCRQYLERHIQPKLAVQCAAALGKRSFLWDVLLDAVLATARKEERRD